MALALLVVATGVTLNFWQQQETTLDTRVAKTPPDPDTPVEPTAVAHSSTAASQPTIVVETLDDDSMLATLASLGINAGMIEVDGVQRLVTPDGGPLDLAAYSNRARSTIDRPKHPHDV
jgi:hypothetical protein